MTTNEAEAYALAMLMKYICEGDEARMKVEFMDTYKPRIFRVGTTSDFIAIITLRPEDPTDEEEYSFYYIHTPTFTDEPGQVSILRKKKTEDIIPHILAF